MKTIWTPIVLLVISNVFMTFAWYGHLRFKSSPLWIVILASWGIALLEYCFQVPANRIGHRSLSAAQLKTIQEIVTLVVFSGFSILYLKEEFRWNYAAGFVLIVAAAFLIFSGKPAAPAADISQGEVGYERPENDSGAGGGPVGGAVGGRLGGLRHGAGDASAE
jgi:uncharacterized protein (DUF486 family)